MHGHDVLTSNMDEAKSHYTDKSKLFILKTNSLLFNTNTGIRI